MCWQAIALYYVSLPHLRRRFPYESHCSNNSLRGVIALTDVKRYRTRRYRTSSGNSLLTGKFTGIFSFFSPDDMYSSPFLQRSCRLRVKFPTARNRDLVRKNREFSRENREFCCGSSGLRYRRQFLALALVPISASQVILAAKNLWSRKIGNSPANPAPEQYLINRAYTGPQHQKYEFPTMPVSQINHFYGYILYCPQYAQSLATCQSAAKLPQ